MNNIIKKWGIAAIAVAALIGSMAFKKDAPYMKTIAITQIVEHPALDATYKGIVDELRSQGFIPGKNIHLVYETAQGSPVMATQIAQRFIGLKPAAAVALGTLSSQALMRASQGTGIPVVFSSVTDPVDAQLVNRNSAPGGNVSGLSNWIEMTPQLRKFKEIVPGLKALGIVYNPGEANSVKLNATVKQKAKKMGIEVVLAPATTSVEVSTAARSLVNEVDAMFVTNDNTALSAFESIVKVATNAGIPVFVSDTDMVQRGAVAAVGPNQYQLGRQTGKMVSDILRGASPATMAVGFPEKSEFYLNLDAVAAIRLAIPDRMKEEADMLVSL